MSSHKRRVLGLDLGGTGIRAAAVEFGGGGRTTVCGSYEGEHRGDFLGAIGRAESWWKAQHGDWGATSTVGVALAGTVDPNVNELIASPSLDSLLGRGLSQYVPSSWQAILLNDANAATLAEAHVGIARDSSCVLGVYLGTGLGAGIVRHGQIEAGAHGAAAEIGHIPFGREAERCPCGGKDCLELTASGRGLIRAANSQAMVAQFDDTRQVIAAARSGDPNGILAIREVSAAVARGISAAVSMVDPDRVVLGGGLLLAATDLFLPMIRQEIGGYGLPLAVRDHKDFLAVSGLGRAAGAIGAAIAAASS